MATLFSFSLQISKTLSLRLCGLDPAPVPGRESVPPSGAGRLAGIIDDDDADADEVEATAVGVGNGGGWNENGELPSPHPSPPTPIPPVWKELSSCSLIAGSPPVAAGVGGGKPNPPNPPAPAVRGLGYP